MQSLTRERDRAPLRLCPLVSGRYEILEHTADVGIEASGATAEEMFEASAEGLAGLMGAWLPGEGEPRDVIVEASDREALLVAWLDEILYLREVKDLLFGRFEVHSVSDGELEATVTAAPAAERDVEGVGIKAATFHRLEVSRQPDGSWRGRVYLDV
jgi:SHS2 domain-containing protein